MKASESELLRKIRQLAKKNAISKPQFFDLNKAGDKKSLTRLLKSGKILSVVDDYTEQLKELFAINHPTEVFKADFGKKFSVFLKNLESKEPLEKHGIWVLFPWLGALVHLLSEADFYRVRTARNRELITSKEQKLYYDAIVGIGGLSVGNSVALAIVLQGGARRVRLADFDRLALTNLNRIRSGVEFLGVRKVELTARQIYALNPYAKVELFPEGLNTRNIKRFFSGPPKLDLVIDELDNLAIKYLIRKYAKRYGVPLIMGADNGDNAVVDIERYDLYKGQKFFNGRLGKVTYGQLTKLDKFGIGKMIIRHIGAENVTDRTQASFMEMGRTIVSWPQLGGAALLNGSALAYCARKILTGQPLEKNRSLISLDEKLTPGYTSKKAQKRRALVSKKFKKLVGLR